ncbi:lysosomal alpha-mannosidase-like [Culicoides brevitarsis]|uniref:lysosomal alpha-mannosidase-like n=1 Tax=Culicoides brevitarsis TaxID=469753 RepID=UPI00307B6170
MKKLIFLIFITGLSFFAEARPNLKKFSETKERVCGYDGCPVPKPGMINVHMVPHTHDDAGWLKTVDQYYYGSKNTIQKAGVQYIIDSVIQELLKDPEKRFIYVESAFFSMWWKEQTPELQEQVKELVNEGRLEFIGGAWSMNDEAGVHYNSVIDHFTHGLKFLSDNFGTCGRPRIGWQIDPFGHSREQASLFAQMGYDGMFFGRIDYQDKELRLANKEMEMIWHASKDLGESSDIFAGVLHNLYQPPSGFCFDILCDNEPIIDNPKSADYNVIERVDTWFEFVRNQSESYRTNNIIMTMGGDFTYMDAGAYYKNMDKLIKYANERNENINMFYSTPSCYLKALHDADVTWPEKSDDFFPYASDLHSYWTGYFTSRPTQKRYERMGNHLLQVCKQLSSFALKHNDEFIPHLNELREIMGVMQHHDAITGTEKQKVAQDYARSMARGIESCSSNIKNVLNQLTTRQTDRPEPAPFGFTMCPNLNISSCEVTERSKEFIVTVYNPLAHSAFEYIRVPVVGDKFLVKDYRNVEIRHQMVPIPATVRNYDMRSSEATHELVFMAPEIPALGFKGFYVTKLEEDQVEELPKTDPQENLIVEEMSADEPEKAEKVTIGNNFFTLSFDEYGLLESLTTVEGEEHRLAQNFFYYQGYLGNNWIPKNRSSGAYIFRPNGTEKFVASRASIEVVRGLHVEEVRQVFNDWVSQVIRVYRDENHIEFEWMVGPIPVEDGIGKEVVSRFYSTVHNDDVFYTDANGRQMVKRVRNYRETWPVNIGESVAGNYYPVTAKIMIEDDENRFAVLNDRAQGGSSLFDGSIELMVHRRLLKDDAFGVEEALNETESNSKGIVARGKHWVVIGKKTNTNKLGWTAAARERFLQNEKLLPPVPFFSDASNTNYTHWMQRYSNIWSVMALPLPRNLHMLTFEPWNQDKLYGHQYIVRFEHLFESDEDPEYSKPIRFNFQDAFRDLDVQWIKETTLAGNQWINEATRFKFRPDSEKDSSKEFSKYESMMRKVTNLEDFVDAKSFGGEVEKMERNARSVAFDYEITLEPMQIRTFIVKMNPEIYDK